MTDKEAFELMVKYTGDEGLSKIRLMIHEIGIDGLVNIMVSKYSKQGMKITPEFKGWMKQSFEYLREQMDSSLN